MGSDKPKITLPAHGRVFVIGFWDHLFGLMGLRTKKNVDLASIETGHLKIECDIKIDQALQLDGQEIDG